jgi:DNA-binding MarR family transcriptional regulator
MTLRRPAARRQLPTPAVDAPASASRPAEVDPSVGYLLRYAHRAFVKALAQELKPHGISTGQWSVLRVLWREERLTQVELAERMRVEKASLTSVLDGMERHGLVVRVRDRDDRRKVNIHLTRTGHELKAALLPCGATVNRRATRGIPEAKLTELSALLEQLTRNLLD